MQLSTKIKILPLVNMFHIILHYSLAFREIELTMLLPWTHLRPASTMGNLEESIMKGTWHAGNDEAVSWRRGRRQKRIRGSRFSRRSEHKNATYDKAETPLYAFVAGPSISGWFVGIAPEVN